MKDNEDKEVIYISKWIGREPTFAENDALFIKYKIENLSYNRLREYYKN